MRVHCIRLLEQGSRVYVMKRWSKSTECTTGSVNLNVNCGLWMGMVCQVGSSAVTNTPLLLVVHSGEGYACM